MSTRVRRANKATSSQLSSVLPKVFDLKGSRYAAQVSTSSELLDADQQSIWELFEQNMRPMYVGSSMGWDPPSKKEELFDIDSRFILLRRSQEQDGTNTLREEPSIVAYSMFRFLIEDGECVLYCYELQVAQGGRRGGIGKALMQCLCEIAHEWDMQKIMLTVFKENQMALLFYKAMGFDIVDSDSDLDHEDDVDYWIMSKDATVTRDA